MENENSKKEITLDDLAVMVQKGFIETGEKIESVRKELKEEMKETSSDIKAELNKKVDIFTHKELEFRVEKLEEKVGLAKKI
jgi:hypothetical protein